MVSCRPHYPFAPLPVAMSCNVPCCESVIHATHAVARNATCILPSPACPMQKNRNPFLCGHCARLVYQVRVSAVATPGGFKIYHANPPTCDTNTRCAGAFDERSMASKSKAIGSSMGDTISVLYDESKGERRKIIPGYTGYIPHAREIAGMPCMPRVIV